MHHRVERQVVVGIIHAGRHFVRTLSHHLAMDSRGYFVTPIKRETGKMENVTKRWLHAEGDDVDVEVPVSFSNNIKCIVIPLHTCYGQGRCT